MPTLAALGVLVSCGGNSNPNPSPNPPSNGPAQHAVTVDVQGSGAVRASGQECRGHCVLQLPGGALHLEAAADSGWHFAEWSGACSGSGACDLSLASDVALAAAFAQDTPPPPPPAKHRLSVAVSGSGSVRSDPAGIDCGSTCAADFDEGANVTLIAAAASGMNFSGWSGACSGIGACAVTLSADASVSAAFAAMPADECAGMLPASRPAAVVVPGSFNPGVNGGCIKGDNDDGDGNFMLKYVTGLGPTGTGGYVFTIQDGKAVLISNGPQHGDEGSFDFFSQPSGFSIYSRGSMGGSTLTTWSHDGKQGGSIGISHGFIESPPAWDVIGIDPSGGTALVRTYTDASGVYHTTYQRVDKSGVPVTGEVVIDTGANSPGAVGITLSGDVLVLSERGQLLNGRWLKSDGSAITDWFQVDALGQLKFLLDGGLARTVGGSDPVINRVFPDGQTISSAPPAWLAGMTWQQAIRGARGYAVYGPGKCGSGGLEVVAKSGKSCGCLSVPGLTQKASVGRDGSLIVPRTDGMCQYDLYPRLFQ